MGRDKEKPIPYVMEEDQQPTEWESCYLRYWIIQRKWLVVLICNHCFFFQENKSLGAQPFFWHWSSVNTLLTLRAEQYIPILSGDFFFSKIKVFASLTNFRTFSLLILERKKWIPCCSNKIWNIFVGAGQ
jgi:hypothetical protein